MRVEIDVEDLVELVKQFLTKHIPDEDLFDDIEQMITYGMDDFKHESRNNGILI